jgi:hypothetical protein
LKVYHLKKQFLVGVHWVYLNTSFVPFNTSSLGIGSKQFQVVTVQHHQLSQTAVRYNCTPSKSSKKFVRLRV